MVIAQLDLFDILGRRIEKIWSGPLAFEKEITFNAGELPSGIYVARAWDVIGNRPVGMTKLVLLK